jgi:CheY-like chemotaxis protein
MRFAMRTPSAGLRDVRPISARPRTILTIDSDPHDRSVLVGHLRNLGYNVLAADDGDQGIQQAAAQRPDLVIVDLRLTDVDGYAVCQELHDRPETRRIPIIVLSAMSRPDIVCTPPGALCRYIVRKPCDLDALAALVQSALAESYAAAVASSSKP